MEPNGTVTRASNVKRPVAIVELKHLRTLDTDEPVRVRVELVDELVLQDATKSLPGASPAGPHDDVVDSEVKPDETLEVRRMKALAPAILEVCTSFDGDDGREVRPAFYWNPAVAVPGSIPGRYLRVEDLTALVHTALRLGGYLGAAGGPAEGSFHGDDARGAPLRVEPLPAGEGHGPDPVGGGA
jgi:hypothetical protein